MEGTVIAGVFGILIGIVLLPPTSKLIKDKLSGGLKFVAVVLLMILGGSLQVAHGTSSTAQPARRQVKGAQRAAAKRRTLDGSHQAPVTLDGPYPYWRETMQVLLALFTEIISYFISLRWQTFIAAAGALLVIWLILMLTR